MLRLIPTEGEPKAKPSGIKNKKIEKRYSNADPFFQMLFRKLGDFFQKEKESTMEQIDDLIMNLQRTVLRLQHKKQQMMKTHEVHFRKKKIM